MTAADPTSATSFIPNCSPERRRWRLSIGPSPRSRRRRRRSRCGLNPRSSRVAPRFTAIGLSTRPRPPRASSPPPSTRKCTTSGSGISGRSATAKCTAFPNGRNFAHSPPPSRSTRSRISTSTSSSSRPTRARTASMCIGLATPPSTTASFTASCSDHGAKTLIKSKSMLTEECGFRPYMASVGIEVIETDLGERIQQLDNEDPSHVVVPAVHKLRTDVAEVFAKTIGTDPNNSDVHYLAEAQREFDSPADPGGRRGHDRRQLRGRGDRRLRRLHQRGQRRPLGERAQAAYRLDRHREDHPPARAPGGVHPPACRAVRWARR